MKLTTWLPAFGLLAASAGVQAVDGSALNEILESGVLKVGTTGDWNPMKMKDPPRAKRTWRKMNRWQLVMRPSVGSVMNLERFCREI